jgi:hypothetical protein
LRGGNAHHVGFRLGVFLADPGGFKFNSRFSSLGMVAMLEGLLDTGLLEELPGILSKILCLDGGLLDTGLFLELPGILSK